MKKKRKPRKHTRMPYLNELDLPKDWHRDTKRRWRRAAIECKKKGYQEDSPEYEKTFNKHGFNKPTEDEIQEKLDKLNES